MPSLDEHLKTLDRNRNLLSFTRDGAVRELRKKLIEETESAIQELAPDRRC